MLGCDDLCLKGVSVVAMLVVTDLYSSGNN